MTQQLTPAIGHPRVGMMGMEAMHGCKAWTPLTKNDRALLLLKTSLPGTQTMGEPTGTIPGGDQPAS